MMVASEREPIMLVSNVREVQYDQIQTTNAPRCENGVNVQFTRRESTCMYDQILETGRDAKAIVKSSTSARLLSAAGRLQSVATLRARLKSPRPLTPPKISISAVWARGQHCPPRLFDIEMMRNRLSDRLSSRVQRCQRITYSSQYRCM